MAVAAEPAELELFPTLDEVRELAREHTLVPLRHTFVADTETPVSAYLKLRGDGPSFLLESAEQGQRFGRWSFLGFRPRAVIRSRQGDPGDPYALVAQERRRSSSRTSAPRATRRRSSAPRSTSAPATSTRWCRASAGAPTRRSRRSR